jgi:dimethylaniline monooxygenase (N-oxide forming)
MTVHPEDRVTGFVAADPMTVWEMVSDITRMGEWSPECYKSKWLTPRRGKGSIFLGLNKDRGLTWPSPAIITESEPGKLFAFRAASGVIWRYLLVPEEDGTRLIEERVTIGEFRWVKTGYRLFLGGYDRRIGVIRAGMRTTLDRIKLAAEQTSFS